MKKLLILLTVITLLACKEEKAQLDKKWNFISTIETEGINPIGIVNSDLGIWLSDGDHNRLVLIDERGKVKRTIDSFERPMHIATDGKFFFVPEYGKDQITMIDGINKAVIPLKDSLDAPAGVSVFKNEMGIADFYNHRILYSKDGTNWLSIGKEGKNEGELYYPTDLQITQDKIWVADAYNNRVQVFDKEGNSLQIIGADEKMNAATGIYVSDDSVFITDFENNRVLVYDLEGKLKQELSENIEKPTDMMIINNKLHVINYRNGQVNVFEWSENGKPSEDGHDATNINK